MEIITTIVDIILLIGIGLVGVVQYKQTKSNDQIITNMKSFMAIIDLQKVKDYVAIREETIKAQSEKEKETILQTVEEYRNKHSDIEQKQKKLDDAWAELTAFSGQLLKLIYPEVRKEMVNEWIQDQHTQVVLFDTINQIEDHYDNSLIESMNLLSRVLMPLRGNK